MTKFNTDTHWLDYAEAHARDGIQHLHRLLGVNFDDLCDAHERLIVLFRNLDKRRITKSDGEDFNLMCSMTSILINVPSVLARFNMAWDTDFSLALMKADTEGTIIRHRYIQNYYSPEFAATLDPDSDYWVSYEAFRLFLEHTGSNNANRDS